MNYMGVWSGTYVPCTDVDCADNDPGEACCYEDADLGLVCDQLLRTIAWVSTATSTEQESPVVPTRSMSSLEDMGACCYNTPDGWVDLKIEEHCIDADDVGDPRFRLQRSADPARATSRWSVTAAATRIRILGSSAGWSRSIASISTVTTTVTMWCAAILRSNATCLKRVHAATRMRTTAGCRRAGIRMTAKDLSRTLVRIRCSAPIRSSECGDVNDDPGACCYDDPDLGFICAMLIQEHCIDLNGYWYGAGVGCADPQVECDLPSGDCIVQPGAECAGRPSYLDPNFSQVFGSGPVAVQTASPNIFQANVLVFDLSNAEHGSGGFMVESWTLQRSRLEPEQPGQHLRPGP